MKRKILLTSLITVCAASACAFAVTACTEYKPEKEIPGINENSVLFIENNRLDFARGMEADAAQVIERCKCKFVNEDGSEVYVTEEHLRDGIVRYDGFDLETTGTNKQIKVYYKHAENFIFYDVNDYTVNFYLDEDKTDLWKSSPASAALDNENKLSVWIDTQANNYSVDGAAIEKDYDRAIRFDGWHFADEQPVTGLRPLSPPASGNVRVTDLHAHFITQNQLSEMNISYSGGKRVFSGYTGEKVQTLKIPEGVTFVDLKSMFSKSPDPTAINFEKLHLPSTARLETPFTMHINTVGLNEITVDTGNTAYSSYNGALYNKDKTSLYLMPASCERAELSDSVTEIASYACASWQISTLTIPESVTTLQHFCFAYSNLIEVSGLENVKNIMTGVFFGTDMNLDNGIALYTRLSGSGSSAKYGLSMILDKSITDYKLMDGTVSIAGDAFYNCANLVSVDLGNELERIGNSAFSECASLKSIKFPSTLKYLGSSVFYNCTSLAKVEGLGNISFSQGRSDYENFLPDRLFYGCASLAELELPAELTHIGASAFHGCTALTEINLPDTVIGINASAFFNCGITSIKLPARLTEIGTAAFSHSKLEEVDFSACVSLSELPSRCFEYTALTSVNLPAAFTEIPDMCFYYITTLQSVKLNGVTRLGERAFGYCSSLGEVDWGKIQSIGMRAFVGCVSLSEVTLPDSLTRIDGYAFQGCTGLKKLRLGSGVRTFGAYAFEDDGKTFGSVSPATYTCNNLEEITVSPLNPYFKSVDGILYGSAVGGREFGAGAVLYAVPCAYAKQEVVLPAEVKVILPYSVHNQKNLVNITLNDGLENIGKGAFYNSVKLESLHIPASVNFLGASILLNCKGIKTFTIDENNAVYNTDGNLIYSGNTLIMYMGFSAEVSIKDGTTQIASGVFMNNNVVTSVKIPDSVTSVGVKAFNGSGNLKSLEIGGGLKDIAADAFSALKSLQTIKVSADNPYFKAENNILYSKDGKKLILCAARNGLTELDVAEGVTEIAEWAFAYHATLRTVKLPDTVKTLGAYSFYECRAAESFYGGKSLESIGDYAFSFATSIDPSDKTETRFSDTLKNVMITENVKSIGNNAFYGQYGIENVFFKLSVNELTALFDNSGINISYLTHGCPEGSTGEYYNNISRYLYIATQPDDLTINYEGYGWFFVDGETPKPW